MAWIDVESATERLRLRSFREADKPTIVRLLTDAGVRRYLGGPAGDEAVAGLRSATVGDRRGAFCIADLSTDVVIGTCSFDRGRGELELSYQLLPEYWGSGLANEAIAAAPDWVWSATDDDSVIAVTQVANEPSLRLLARWVSRQSASSRSSTLPSRSFVSPDPTRHEHAQSVLS